MTPNSFEEAMDQLKALVEEIEKGTMPLEHSVEAYQKGVALVKYCTEQLKKVENQISVLDKDLLKPFESE